MEKYKLVVNNEGTRLDEVAAFCWICLPRHYSAAICSTSNASARPPVTKSEVLSSSEKMRGVMDDYAHATSTSPILERVANRRPSLLAGQQRSAYRGEGAALLRELAATIDKTNRKLSVQPISGPA